MSNGHAAIFFYTYVPRLSSWSAALPSYIETLMRCLIQNLVVSVIVCSFWIGIILHEDKGWFVSCLRLLLCNKPIFEARM